MEEGPGAEGARGGGGHSDQVCSSSPGIETSPHAVSVLARPSAESARTPHFGDGADWWTGAIDSDCAPEGIFWSPFLPQQEISNWQIRTV